MILRVISKCVIARRLTTVATGFAGHINFRSVPRHSAVSTFLRHLSSLEEPPEQEEITETNQLIELKYLLYPNSNDPVIEKINNCKTLDQFKSISELNLKKEQLVQMVLALWELVKPNRTQDIIIDSVVRQLQPFLSELTFEELSVVMLYISKLGLDIKTPFMQKLIDICIKSIEHSENFPLSALSRFTVTINTEKGLYSTMISIQTMPTIIRYLQNCTNAEDFRLVTICLNSIHHVVTMNVLELFKKKVEEFVDKEILNETTAKSILKIINFLNYPHWSQKNALLIRRLILTLEDNIQHFEARELKVINRAFQTQLESARLVPKIVERSKNLIQNSPDVELLSLALLYSSPAQRTKIADLVRDFVHSYQISSSDGESLQNVFKVIRLLKISDINLCDSYWTKVVNEIYTTKESDLTHRLTRHVHRYSYFNNNLGGTYRHLEFEKCIIDILMKELRSGPSAILPHHFARLSCFIIGYGDGTENATIPEFIMQKIINMKSQFSVMDCLQLSRGLQILQEMRFKYSPPRELKAQVETLHRVLDDCAKRHMKRTHLTLSEMNKIIRAYNNRKAQIDTHLFHEMISYYESNRKFELNSRIIRDIIFNLIACNFQMDSISDQFVDYVLDNHEHVTGESIEKILTYFYNFSYFPEKLEVLDRCSEIILRDFNYMTGLSIVQALLALVFYKACPQQLLTMVFNGDFIKRLEQEIEMCYSRATYPQRVMKQLMQLNRAACLDCPELNMPWFQQNYIEAQMSKLPVFQSRFNSEVKKILTKIVADPSLIGINHVTPYGYRIDFVVNIDNYNKFVKPIESHLNDGNNLINVNKIAILLLRLDMFCNNDINRLRGSELLRTRHLEILGYRVIHLKINDLNSLYHNFGAKIKYLKKLLTSAHS